MFSIAITVAALAFGQNDNPNPPNPPAATFHVWQLLETKPNGDKRWSGGSGTCVWTERGKSVILTCNHIFTDVRDAENRHVKADYPIEVLIQTGDKSKSYKGVAIDGDPTTDTAVVIVEGALPYAEVSEEDVPDGATVWHKGYGSGGGEGVAYKRPSILNKYGRYSSTCPSVFGDSGAGVIARDTGRLVAVHCGTSTDDGRARGAPVSEIRPFLGRVVSAAFPRLAYRLGAKTPPAVTVVAQPVTMEYTLADGKVVTRTYQPGEKIPKIGDLLPDPPVLKP